MLRSKDFISEGKSMNNEEKKPEQSDGLDRRGLVRAGVKAAYMIPAILAAVKATERPAYAGSSGAPVVIPFNP
jgi:hypothetical protein